MITINQEPEKVISICVNVLEEFLETEDLQPLLTEESEYILVE